MGRVGSWGGARRVYLDHNDEHAELLVDGPKRDDAQREHDDDERESDLEEGVEDTGHEGARALIHSRALWSALEEGGRAAEEGKH